MKKYISVFMLALIIVTLISCKSKSVFDDNKNFKVEYDKNFDVTILKYKNIYVSFSNTDLEDFSFSYGETLGLYYPVKGAYEVSSSETGEICDFDTKKNTGKVCTSKDINDAKLIQEKYKSFLKEIKMSEKEFLENLKMI